MNFITRSKLYISNVIIYSGNLCNMSIILFILIVTFSRSINDRKIFTRDKCWNYAGIET